MAGSTRSVRRKIDSTMDSKWSRQRAGSSPETPDGGGPPVLFSQDLDRAAQLPLGLIDGL